MRRSTGVALLALLLTGCAAGLGSSPAGVTSSALPTSSGPTGLPGTPEGIPDSVWAAVIADLAQRSDAATIDPTVVSAEPMTWNDGSLGCPEPGQMYTQALVDGYQVVLELGGERFDYRIGNGTDVRLCEGVREGG